MNHTSKEPCQSPSQSAINHPENWRLENQNQSSDGLHGAPWSVNNAQKKNSDKILVFPSSPLRREKKKPNTQPSRPDDSEDRDSATSQQKVLQIILDNPPKQHFFAADSCLPTSSEILRTTSLNNTDLSERSFGVSRDVDKERENSSDVRENITSDSQVQPCTTETNGPLRTMGNGIPIQDASDSDFCSLTFLTMQLLGKEAPSISCRGDRTRPAEGCANSSSISFPVSEHVLNPSPLLSSSHQVTRHSELVETPENTVSFSQYDGVGTEQEKVHGDVTYRDINEAMLHSDSSANTQLLEMKSTQNPIARLASCNSLTSKSPCHDNIHSSVECDQTESHGNHVETTALSRTEVPAMASITGELDQRVTTQNCSEGTVDSNCPMAIRKPSEPAGYLENVEDDNYQAPTVVKSTCRRDFGNITGENQNEICSQMDLLSDSIESACTGHATEKLFLIDKALSSETAPNSNGGDESLGLNNFQQEPAECKKLRQEETLKKVRTKVAPQKLPISL